MVGFWKMEVSIGVQFLFAAQKDDSENGEQGTVVIKKRMSSLTEG